MKPRVYIETTIVSYLTARTNRDVIVASHQAITSEWWVSHQHRYELVVSQIVTLEAAAGDPVFAARRLDVLRNIRMLDIDLNVQLLAKELQNKIPLPPKAEVDALHIAVAAVHGIEYLLTWNCAHIANAKMRGKIENICRAAGFEPPVICTPLELSEEPDHA